MKGNKLALEYEALACEFTALCTEVKGMEAANMERSYLGNAPAYSENAFVVMADKMRGYAERFRNLSE